MAEGLEGLEGVIAAETVLSEVDGDAGRLLIRGRELVEIAGAWAFEDMVRLLWGGFFPDLPEDLHGALGPARVAVFEEVAALDAGIARRSTVEAVRALLARLPDGDKLETAPRLTPGGAGFTAAA